MPTESLPEHLRKPHLRPIQPLQVKKDGTPLVALRDPAMLSQQTMVVPPQFMQVLQFFRGDRAIEEIAGQFGAPVDQFIELVKGLDRVGLLWGPTFERLEDEMRTRIRDQGYFPILASGAMGQDESTCRETMEKWFSETDDPELDGEPLGIVAPHLDYQRGWPNYAAAYYGLRNLEAPDRVVILGTNHLGIGDGVVLTEFGFASPMGQCPPDEKVISAVVDQLDRPIIIDQLDHLAEHSIQIHLPWLQYCFGNVPLVAALIPDPLTPMIEEDGERITMGGFVNVLSDVLESVGGRTFFIASSDLSHVGPQFGDPRPVDERRRVDVERHDRDQMSKFVTGDPDEFLSAIEWTKNPTRWCSVGNMTALLRLARPSTVELIDYRQAYDEQGFALVSSAAMALY